MTVNIKNKVSRNKIDVPQVSVKAELPFDKRTIVDIYQPRILKDETAIEEFQVLLHQESNKYLNTFSYLYTNSSKRNPTHLNNIPTPLSTTNTNDKSNTNCYRVNENWRQKICEWSFNVVDHFKFDREVVSIALNYLDRVAAIKSQESSRISISSLSPSEEKGRGEKRLHEFRLTATACLYIAIKVHGEVDSFDRPRRKVRIQSFTELSRGLFTEEMIEAKELEILQILKWNLNPPTTARFAVSLLQLVPAWTIYKKPLVNLNAVTALCEMARFLSELAVCVSTFTFDYKPSEVAFACILCAFNIIRKECTLSLPYIVEIQFIKNVSLWTNNDLTPRKVFPIRELLMELCPEIFESNDDKKDEEKSQSIDGDKLSCKSGNIYPVHVTTHIKRSGTTITPTYEMNMDEHHCQYDE
mmetsp:Transcript_23015/g.25377  ORF Transcript_23015/g.25377 Transcript_23015/m.25377 type:complete len:414 (+) Transcript_23015:62-1303(+)